MQTQSVITCPVCHHASAETMPTDACQFFYDCKGCGARLKPKSGDCCVFLFVRIGPLSADPAERKVLLMPASAGAVSTVFPIF
ncbi:hypothetical protein JOE50_004945 [Bradyrhizobium japonicum]|nr:hypothetical protein [Bradyrhizobium japonicum]